MPRVRSCAARGGCAYVEEEERLGKKRNAVGTDDSGCALLVVAPGRDLALVELVLGHLLRPFESFLPSNGARV